MRNSVPASARLMNLPFAVSISSARYGDMQAFCDKLRAMGYERAGLMMS